MFFLLVSACVDNTDTSKTNGSTANASEKSTPAQCINSQSQCEIATKSGSFLVKFSQINLSDKVKTELPFTIELSQMATDNPQLADTSNVSAYLEGKDMFMGKVPVFFKQGLKGNVLEAESLLASCSEEHMVWRLWVTTDVGGVPETFFVDFTSQRL